MASAAASRFFGSALLLLLACAASAQLSPSFYDKSCPRLRSMVRDEMRRALRKEPRLGASILRMFFHDCFVLHGQGCDASLLLDGDSGEKNARPNRNSTRGFEVIDAIKARVERACSGVVSCADIVALAAREGVVLLGGPSFHLGLGRRDSLTTGQSAADSGQLPGPDSSLDNLIARFDDKGLGVTDLIALYGAHSIGQAQCSTFRDHIYNDTNIDPSFAARLRRTCPSTPGGDADRNLAPLDSTPRSFDNRYFRELLHRRGLLHSDQVLLDNGTTDSLVRWYAFSRTAFFRDFSAAMTKMSNINPLTGSDGEIRRNCRVVN